MMFLFTRLFQNLSEIESIVLKLIFDFRCIYLVQEVVIRATEWCPQYEWDQTTY